MKTSILPFSPIFNGCVETNVLGLPNCGILQSAMSYEWRMYSKACLSMPKAPKFTIQQTFRISALDLLDFFDAVGDSSEIQGGIQKVVK